MARQRDSYKTMSLEGLELMDSRSYPQTTWSKEHRYDKYRLRQSETDKTRTTYYLQVGYDKIDGVWVESQRYKYYQRRAKYLAINGPHENTYILKDTPGYKMFYTQYGTGDSNLPRRVLIDVDSMARKLGLLW